MPSGFLRTHSTLQSKLCVVLCPFVPGINPNGSSKSSVTRKLDNERAIVIGLEVKFWRFRTRLEKNLDYV